MVKFRISSRICKPTFLCLIVSHSELKGKKNIRLKRYFQKELATMETALVCHDHKVADMASKRAENRIKNKHGMLVYLILIKRSHDLSYNLYL